MKPSEILTGAREYIKKHGWCRQPRDEKGRVCILVANREAAQDTFFSLLQ